MKKLTILILTIWALLIFGCSKNESVTGGKLKIVATTGMIADAVKNVGGDAVQVKALMGPGVDPHLYKASEGDVTRMMNANIIFYNGLHLEGKMTEIFEQMQKRIKTVAVAEAVPDERLISPPEFEGAHDPHIWFDVALWQIAVEKIRDELAAADSLNAPLFQENAAKYLAGLAELDAYAKSEIQKIPPEKRILVTAHDAFNYFGIAYGMEVRGLQGISTAAEAGTGDVQKLAEYIVKKQLPAIFVETSVPKRYIEALSAAVRSRDFDVQIGGNLFSDAMGAPGTPEADYIGMVRYNINTIVNALAK